MSSRKTIVIGDDLDKKLRKLQAKKIQKTNGYVSYSEIINELLRKQVR
jgi:predicted CopG family antitoxin